MVDEILKKMLIKDEDKRKKLYRDTSNKIGFEGKRGLITIGIGYNIDERGLPDDIIDILFNRDVKQAKIDLFTALPWAFELDENRQAVLLNMTYNLGLGGLLEFKHMLDAAKSGRYSEAATEMKNSLWARQVGNRADYLSKIMETGKL